MALTAQAVEWSGEVTLEGNITEDVTLTGDTVLTSNLAPGSQDAYTISGKITGSYKLTKKGVGRIILTNAENDFGSLQIDAGFVEATKAGALGTAPITIAGSTTSHCQLRFSTGSTGANFSNAIHVQKTSTAAYPAIWFDRPTKMLTLSGAITSDGTLYMVDAYGGDAAGGNNFITISGPITMASGKSLVCPISYNTVISGKVIADVVSHPGGYNIADGCGVADCKPRGSLGLSNAGNQIGKLQVASYGNIHAVADNAFVGAWLYQAANTETGRGQFRINGKSQTCAYISTGTCAAGNLSTTAMAFTGASTASTLTLTGGVSSATSYSYFTGNQTIKIDDKSEAGNFVQTFHSRPSPMTGKLIANRGTLRMAGTSKFAAVSAIEVGNGGTFDCQTTAEGSLSGVTNVSVASGGTLAIGANAPTPFTGGKCHLELTSGATLNLANDLTVASASVDGVAFPKGTWTGMAGINFTGNKSITVSEGPDPVYTWTEEGSDSLITNPDNWFGPDGLHSVPNLTDGTTRIAVGGGKSVKITSDVKVKELVINEGGYTLDAASGATFTIAGKLTANANLANATEYLFEGEEIEIEVAEGKTLNYSAAIAGTHKVKKSGLGTLVMPDAKAYTGGTEIAAGVLEMQDKDSLGTGDITVDGSANQIAQLKFRVPQSEAWITNAIVIASSSSREYPAFNFATNTYLSGAITANGDLYMADTGYGANAAAATLPYIKFKGEVSVANGFRIASAPHCRIAFEAKLSTPILEGYYVDGGTAANDGNAGSFRLSQAADNIGRIILDQTSIFCLNANVCTNTIVEWTGEHAKNGVGYFDMNGKNQSFGGFYTAGACANATEGLQLMTSTGKPTATFNCSSTSSDYWYFVIEQNVVFGQGTFAKAPWFCHRRNMAAGQINHSKSWKIGPGASFPLMTGSEGSSGQSLSVNSDEPDVLDGLTWVKDGSSTVYLNTAAAVACVSRGHKCKHESARTGNKPTINYGFYIPSGCTLDLKSAKWHVKAATEVMSVVDVPCGIYTSADYFECNGGTFRVWAPRTAWTNATWKATEANAELADAANWTVADDGKLVFGVPLVKATINGGEGVSASATATNLVNFGKLTFGSAATDFTVSGSGIVAFYDDGIASVAGTSGRTFTFNVPVDFQTNQIAIAAQDTLKLAGGLTNEVWRTTVESFEIGADNRGTIELGGVVPTNLVVRGGTLAFAEGAELPEDNTMVLKLGADAKIKVASGNVLKVKCVTTNGVAVSVGYFAEGFVTGGGKVRVDESTAPMEPETLTWVNTGSEGLVSEHSNWNPSEIEWTWANKYFVSFAPTGNGSGAVVDGAYSFRGISFNAPTDAGFQLLGSAGAAITLGTDGITTLGEVDSPARQYRIKAPIALTADTTVAVATNDTLTIEGDITGTGKLTMTNDSTLRLVGNNTFAGGYTGASNTILTLTGVFGAENNSDTIYSRGARRDCICLSNVVLRTKYLSVEAPLTDSSSYGYWAQEKWFEVAPNSTNEILGTFGYSGTTTYFAARKNSKVTIYNGYHNSSKIHWQGSGEFVYVGDPVICYERTGDGYVQVNSGTTLTLDCTNCEFKVLNFGGGGNRVNFMRSGVFKESRSATKVDVGYNYIDAGGNAVIDFHSTTQHIGFVTGSVATFTGTEGSRMVVRQTPPNSKIATLAVPVVGNLSVEAMMTNAVAGVCTNTLQIVGAKTSAGDLVASAGTIGFASGSSWCNGTNLVVREKGVIKFSGSDNVNGEIAALKLMTGGKVNIPSGITVRVATAETNGVSLAIGSYTAHELGDFITGSGKIRVGTPGTTFIIK